MNDRELFLIDGNIVECKFGLKALIFLSQSTYDIDKNFDFLWKLGTKNMVETPKDKQIIKKFKDFFSTVEIPSSQEFEELYVCGLGELNICLDTLENMTPQQIKLAYQGYLRRIELQSNLFKLGMLEALHENTDYMEIINKEFELGTKQEREKVFASLNLKEESI